MRTREGSGLLISMLEKFDWFCLISLMRLVLSMWKWMDLLLSKNYLLGCWGCLSLLNWIGALTLFLLLKLKPWFILWSFLFLYLYKSTILLCAEYCCHVWAGAPSCCVELLGKPQNWVSRTVGPLLAFSLESLADHRNVAKVFSKGITLVDVHLNWLNWFPF